MTKFFSVITLFLLAMNLYAFDFAILSRSNRELTIIPQPSKNESHRCTDEDLKYVVTKNFQDNGRAKSYLKSHGFFIDFPKNIESVIIKFKNGFYDIAERDVLYVEKPGIIALNGPTAGADNPYYGVALRYLKTVSHVHGNQYKLAEKYIKAGSTFEVVDQAISKISSNDSNPDEPSIIDFRVVQIAGPQVDLYQVLINTKLMGAGVINLEKMLNAELFCISSANNN